MTYYSVAEITGRRINDDDGSIEYAVKWEGSPEEVTWEKRQNLMEYCADTVREVDQRCMYSTQKEIRRWRDEEWSNSARSMQTPPRSTSTTPGQRKRARSSSPDAGEVLGKGEVLNSLLLHIPRRYRHGDAASPAEEGGAIIMLGEVVLEEQASAVLNRSGGFKKKGRLMVSSVPPDLHISPALRVEKMWRDTQGQSLLQSIEAAHSVTPFHPHFRLRRCDAATLDAMAQEAKRSSNLRIISIAPPLKTHSGAVFGLPVALDPLVGEQDLEQLRLSVQLESPLFSSAAEELVKPHVEQMVVRYIVPEVGPTTTDDLAAMETEPHTTHGRIASMPLSVFRMVFPQLLIDYLLQNSVVLR